MANTSTTVAEKVLLASMRARMPAVLVGPPGVGKTAKLYELTRRMGYELITLIGSQLDPTDIVGLPKGEQLGVTDKGKKIYGTVNLSPWWQVEILVKKKIVLFLDEWSNTSAATRASMLTMLQSREFPNGQKMPAETIVVGAMNPAEQAADGYELDYPTTNRINFIVWAPSVEEWKKGMLNAWGKTVSEEEMEWRKSIVRFIEDNPAYLQKLPEAANTVEAFSVNSNDPSEMEVFRYAWPSRRSWDNLSRVLGKAGSEPIVQDTIAQGIVGYECAQKFRDWLKRKVQMTPGQLMKTPKSMIWSKANHDEATYLLGAVLDLISDDKTSEQAISVFENLATQNMHALGAGFLRDLMSKVVDSRVVTNDTIEKNRKRMSALGRSFGALSSNM